MEREAGRRAVTSIATELGTELTRTGPASCDELARAVGRRRTDVRRTLVDDSRFVRSGRGPRSRWQLATNIDGDGNGTDSNERGGVEPTSDTLDAGEGRTASRCSEPERHAGNRAHWRDEDGVTWCVVCDPPPEPRPLTFREWADGLGDEDRRHRFEADYAALVRHETTPEQRERMDFAFAEAGGE